MELLKCTNVVKHFSINKKGAGVRYHRNSNLDLLVKLTIVLLILGLIADMIAIGMGSIPIH